MKFNLKNIFFNSKMISLKEKFEYNVSKFIANSQKDNFPESSKTHFYTSNQASFNDISFIKASYSIWFQLEQAFKFVHQIHEGNII